MKKMISTTPACTTWCIKWWICGWSYWLNIISSTMIIFSLVYARSVFGLPCFGSSNFWKFTFHSVLQRHVLGVVKSLTIVFITNFQECVSERIWKIC